MARGLEARVERLEAAQGWQTYGLQGGRELARLCFYNGEEADAKAKVFAGLPLRSHEEWLSAMNDRDLVHRLVQGPEREMVLMRIILGCGADHLHDDTRALLVNSPEFLAYRTRADEFMPKRQGTAPTAAYPTLKL